MSEKAETIRLLFVDDEESIRVTLAAVLRKQGLDVTAVATVGDALTLVNCCQYDVLLCDLNIEKPGDGFTVIGAMRYAQPHCINLVLTAYPSFENALQAIQHQVDEFFTKPTDVDNLVKSIRTKLDGKKAKLPVPITSLAVILRQNARDIIEAVWSSAKIDSILGSATTKTWDNELPKIIDAVIEYVDVGQNGIEPKALKLGVEYGRRLKAQGYDARMVVREFQLMGERIFDLLSSDRVAAAPLGMSADLMKLVKAVNALTSEALRSYTRAQQSRVLRRPSK